jgi:predicted transposase YbfD/YdcC
VDIEAYGRAKYAWLKRFLSLPHGILSHEAFVRVFARLEPEALRTWFLACLTEGQEQLGGPLASQLVAIDGKAARHSFDRAIDRGPLHMVSTWATAAHLVLGQVVVDQKSHEITAVPTLLELLELAGCVVTIDTMGTQKEIAKTIREQEADDVLALKGNQGTLHEDVALLFEWADAQQYRHVVHRTYETHNPGHGREERRRTTVTNALTGLRGYEDWVGLQTDAMGAAWRTQGNAVSYERRDYNQQSWPGCQADGGECSGPLGDWAGAPLGTRHRFSRRRRPYPQGARPENFAMLWHLALNLLKQEKTNRHGVKVKRNRAAGWWNAPATGLAALAA